MTQIPQIRNFLPWRIKNVVRKVKQFVAKCYITWLIELAKKLYDTEKFLDFILCYVLFKNCLALLRNLVNKTLRYKRETFNSVTM